MNHEEYIMPIVTLSSKHQWWGQIYVVIVIYANMLNQLIKNYTNKKVIIKN